MADINTYFFALAGGILPALVWLAFWLREDYKHPEPKGLIMWTFLLGMGAVIVVLPFQRAINEFLPGLTLSAIVLISLLEETFKLISAWGGGLRSPEDNEPIDPIIYMITAALGFAALENVLFIFGWLNSESVTASVSIIGGNFRFIGATLLHVISSAIIGVAMGFHFYKSRVVQAVWTIIALILATIFHAGFNLAILRVENGTALAFGVVWISVVFLLLAFEKVKTIARGAQKAV